jgi:hypothetical protein
MVTASSSSSSLMGLVSFRRVVLVTFGVVVLGFLFIMVSAVFALAESARVILLVVMTSLVGAILSSVFALIKTFLS